MTKQPPAKTRYLMAKDVVIALRITPATLTRWVAAGKIVPAIVTDGDTPTRIYDAADVERLVRERQGR
jgi:hypothetical protein